MGLNRNLGQLTEVITEQNGNIGIGISNISSATNQRVLEINAPLYSTVLSSSQTVKIVSTANSQSGWGAIGTESNHPVVFVSNSSERMRIFSSGNVFIGTSASDAGYRLEVDGFHAVKSGGFGGGGYILKSYPTGASRNWGVFNDQLAWGDFMITTSSTQTGTPNTPRLYINSSGDVHVGTSGNSGYRLFVEGGGSSPLGLRHSSSASGRFWKVGPDSASNFIVYNENNNGCFISWTATSWTGNSDLRLKNVIRKIENATDDLLTLNPVIFSWKNDNTNKENIGLIAQDVEKVFPQLIDKNSDGMLGVRYTELVPILIKAIQELKEEIEILKQNK
jgi:hypothetical protein